MEMERYVDKAFGRECEEPSPWPLVALKDAAAPAELGCFYPMRNFSLHGRSGLPFPSFLSVSRNHFSLEWLGERRLKNCVMALEWVPSVAALAPRCSDGTSLTAEQDAKLRGALHLFDLEGDGRFDAAQLREILLATGDALTLDEVEAVIREEAARAGAGGGAADTAAATAAAAAAATAVAAAADDDDDDDEALLATVGGAIFGVDATSRVSGATTLGTEEVMALLVSGRHRREQSGREWVLLSLAEAETLRCIVHLRQGSALIDGADCEVALRCVSNRSAIFDSSASQSMGTPRSQAALSHVCLRFLDAAMHYKPADLARLLRALPTPKPARQIFFTSALTCRRRLAKKWEATPLAAIFSLYEDVWSLLVLRAMVLRVRVTIASRGLLAHDAFLKFDADCDGRLSLVEIYGALEWLGLAPTPDEVVSFARSLSAEAALSYSEFVTLLTPPSDEDADDDARAGAAEDAAPMAIAADGGVGAAGGAAGGASGGSGAAAGAAGFIEPRGDPAQLLGLLRAIEQAEADAQMAASAVAGAQLAAAQRKMEELRHSTDFGWRAPTPTPTLSLAPTLTRTPSLTTTLPPTLPPTLPQPQVDGAAAPPAERLRAQPAHQPHELHVRLYARPRGAAG